MSRGAQKISTKKSLADLSRSSEGGGKMWMKFFEGDHLSIDMIIWDGSVKSSFAFKGTPHSKFFGAFESWEFVSNFKLPRKIRKWVLQHFAEYRGIVNLETIGGKIIECHLRVGDINHIDAAIYAIGKTPIIGKNLIECYSGKKPSKISNSKIPTTISGLVMLPLFVSKSDAAFVEDSNPSLESVLSLAKEKYPNVLMVQRDPHHSFVGQCEEAVRMWCITGIDKQECESLRTDIEELMVMRMTLLNRLTSKLPFNKLLHLAIRGLIIILGVWLLFLRRRFS
jgi:hypothetical protein